MDGNQCITILSEAVAGRVISPSILMMGWPTFLSAYIPGHLLCLYTHCDQFTRYDQSSTRLSRPIAKARERGRGGGLGSQSSLLWPGFSKLPSFNQQVGVLGILLKDACRIGTLGFEPSTLWLGVNTVRHKTNQTPMHSLFP